MRISDYGFRIIKGKNEYKDCFAKYEYDASFEDIRGIRGHHLRSSVVLKKMKKKKKKKIPRSGGSSPGLIH